MFVAHKLYSKFQLFCVFCTFDLWCLCTRLVVLSHRKNRRTVENDCVEEKCMMILDFLTAQFWMLEEHRTSNFLSHVLFYGVVNFLVFFGMPKQNFSFFPVSPCVCL